ncbi:MAG: DUF4338 domain-containing protein [Planctomycetia bacterium]|nr:DUF4338 domain-containing protein [Planctomycetia bacterium]
MLNDKQPLLNLSAGKIQDISLDIVKTPKQSRIWNEMIHRWHYLGYKKLVGSQLRYLINSRSGILGSLGFGISLECAGERRFYRLESSNWEQNLHLIVNNPGFDFAVDKMANLASRVLGLVAKNFQMIGNNVTNIGL